MTEELRHRNLILHERVDEYDGTTAVVRSEALPAEDIEFLRWKAERWMKLRITPTVLFHDPMFVLQNGVKMMRHIFRGTTLKSLLGLEDERLSFERYRALRRAEREYL